LDDVIEHPWLSAVWATSGDENEENEDPPEDCWFQKFPKSMVSRFDPVDTNKIWMGSWHPCHQMFRMIFICMLLFGSLGQEKQLYPS